MFPRVMALLILKVLTAVWDVVGVGLTEWLTF